MTHPACNAPIPWEVMIDYLLGELPRPEEEQVEEHVFECASCTGRMESIASITAGISSAIRGGEVGAVVNEELLERLRSEGATLREYRVGPGETVACTAGPELFTALHISGPFAGSADLVLNSDFEDLTTGRCESYGPRLVRADLRRQEVVLLFPGETVRGYPRSRWTMRIRGRAPAGPVELGTFVLDHTPASGGT